MMQYYNDYYYYNYFYLINTMTIPSRLVACYASISLLYVQKCKRCYNKPGTFKV